MTELVETMRNLVRLNEPEFGGPYRGWAATECVRAMSLAITRIEAQAAEIARLQNVVARLSEDVDGLAGRGA